MLVLAAPAPAAAEWQVKPFGGLTFHPTTTYYDFEFAAGQVGAEGVGVEDTRSSHFAWGGAVLLLGEMFGLEAEYSRASGFFESGDQELVLSSGVSTVTGSFVVALPRRISEYTLRPYGVVGLGTIGVRSEQQNDVFSFRDRLTVIDVGGGATGFLTDRMGVNWDVRHFRSVGGREGDTLLTPDGARARLSFWRANMAFVVRY
jgi:hypothetical protein